MTSSNKDLALTQIKLVYFFPKVIIKYVTPVNHPQYSSYFTTPTDKTLLESMSQNIPLVRWTRTTGTFGNEGKETHWDIWDAGTDSWAPILSDYYAITPEYKATVTLLGLEV